MHHLKLQVAALQDVLTSLRAESPAAASDTGVPLQPLLTALRTAAMELRRIGITTITRKRSLIIVTC